MNAVVRQPPASASCTAQTVRKSLSVPTPYSPALARVSSSSRGTTSLLSVASAAGNRTPSAFGTLVPDIPLASSAVPRIAWPILGLTSTQAVRVVLAAFGKNVSATVVSVPSGVGKAVGVFLAWIPVAGNSFSSSDVTSETAYDQSGHVIAHASNPP